jgi:hypothetical protein
MGRVGVEGNVSHATQWVPYQPTYQIAPYNKLGGCVETIGDYGNKFLVVTENG